MPIRLEEAEAAWPDGLNSVMRYREIIEASSATAYQQHRRRRGLRPKAVVDGRKELRSDLLKAGIHPDDVDVSLRDVAV